MNVQETGAFAKCFPHLPMADSAQHMLLKLDSKPIENTGKAHLTASQIASVELKSCSTCEHRIGRGRFASCMASGFYCAVERKMPSVCGDYRAWIPRRGLVERIRAYFMGAA